MTPQPRLPAIGLAIALGAAVTSLTRAGPTAVPGLNPSSIKSGSSIDLPWPGLANPLVIRLPDNFSPRRSWPVVFHYHGTGGSPNVTIPLDYTHGNDFVLIGMEYATRNMEPLPDNYLELEITSLRQIRDQLATPLHLDKKRVYVGGFSKGGWFAAEFAEVHMEDFAGAYILGAGKSHRRTRQPKAFSRKKPVHIGIGSSDPNFIYSIRAINHFKRLGASVTFDEYLGHGHTIALGSHPDFPRAISLEQWFSLEAHANERDTRWIDAAQWKSRGLARAGELDDPIDQTIHLLRLRRQPFFLTLDENGRREIESRLKSASSNRSVKTELALRARYLKLLDKESQTESWEHDRAMAFEYHQLYTSNPDSWFARRAALECHRLKQILNMTGRWRFPTPDARERAARAQQSNPIPDVPHEKITLSLQKKHRLFEKRPQ